MAPWLITWEATNARLLPEKRIAAVLDGRIGYSRVQEVMESLYASYAYSEADLVSLCSVLGKNPYTAQFGDIDGVQFREEMTCGHNPFLRARKVDNLRVVKSKDGTESVTWRERKRPELPPVLRREREKG